MWCSEIQKKVQFFYLVLVPESPLKNQEFLKNIAKTKVENVNTTEYWRLVRFYLYNKLGHQCLNGPVTHSIKALWRRHETQVHSPHPPTMAHPKEDASFLCLNKHRKSFDHVGFFKRYPSAKKKIEEVQEKIGIRYV